MKLSEEVRNNDVWWDSKILFRDQRYLFKRNMNMGPVLEPWLVPQGERIGCVAPEPYDLNVPQQTNSGRSFYEYYTFTITPDTAMFYGKKGNLVHTSFAEFTTKDYPAIVNIIAVEMEKVLLTGFDKRDCCDPVIEFKNVKRVGLAVVTRK